MTERPVLSAKMPPAIAALARGDGQAAAAAAAGVSDRTIRRWLGDAAFSGALREVIDVAFFTGMAVLSDVNADANRYIAAVVRGEVPADPHRLNAARLAVTLGTTQREAVDLAGRVAALERRTGVNDGSRTC